MSFLPHLSALSSSDFILLIPMALVGMILTSELPSHTRIAHYSFEIGGAVVGMVAALLLLSGLTALF